MAYPSFDESRFMAYDAIVHGARGILYWGSHYLKSSEFRQSLYALTSELAALQPFLVAEDDPQARLALVELEPDPSRESNLRKSKSSPRVANGKPSFDRVGLFLNKTNANHFRLST
ncbi:MAG: hypothetical protein A2Z25_03485 [Planctomycetes bacterium RBG_16_55_9]|nr:MAG: hypothetical protein A2Z25_03485 [Planctomycetes bacterium RBG_16_55_9]